MRLIKKRYPGASVQIIEHEPRVNSKFLSERLGVGHKATINLINKHNDKLSTLGKVVFQIRPLPSGQKEKFALLNEEQSVLILTLSKNNEKVVELKLDLTKKFFAARRQLESRIEGKYIRTTLTDAVKRLEEIAVKQNPNHKHPYYCTFTKLAYSAMGFSEKRYSPDFRDKLNGPQLRYLMMTEQVLADAIMLCVNQMPERPYKEIYHYAKEKVMEFARIMNFPKLLEVA